MRIHRKVSLSILIIIGCASILGSANICTMSCDSTMVLESEECRNTKQTCHAVCMIFPDPWPCFDNCNEVHECCVEESAQQRDVCVEYLCK